MLVYQLIARGSRKSFDNPGYIKSRKIFRTKAGAEKYAEEFKQLCCGAGLFDLDIDDTVVVFIEELLLQEE